MHVSDVYMFSEYEACKTEDFIFVLPMHANSTYIIIGIHC